MASTPFKNNAENKFNRMIVYSIIISLLAGILGIVLLFLPELTNKVVGVLVGIVFLLFGMKAIYEYFHRDGAKLYSLSLVFGILYALLGVFIILFPFSVMQFVTICLGLFIIINGASKINYAFWLKKGGEESWLVTLVTGILLIVLGILVAFNPFVSFTITKLTGIFLIIVAVLDIMDAILFKSRAQEILDIFW